MPGGQGPRFEIVRCCRNYSTNGGKCLCRNQERWDEHGGDEGQRGLQDQQAGDDRRHANEPGRLSVFREVHRGGRNSRISAGEVWGGQEESEKGDYRKLVSAGAGFLLRWDEPTW